MTRPLSRFDHRRWPVRAANAKIRPLSEPTYTVLPATAGLDRTSPPERRRPQDRTTLRGERPEPPVIGTDEHPAVGDGRRGVDALPRWAGRTLPHDPQAVDVATAQRRLGAHAPARGVAVELGPVRGSGGGRRGPQQRAGEGDREDDDDGSVTRLPGHAAAERRYDHGGIGSCRWPQATGRAATRHRETRTRPAGGRADGCGAAAVHPRRWCQGSSLPSNASRWWFSATNAVSSSRRVTSSIRSTGSR